jgi:hypothetical protein
MFSLRTHALICGGLLAALIGSAIAGNALQAAGVIPPAGAGPVVIVVFMTLFVAFGFSCVPVMVKLVLGAQKKLGNAEKPAIKAVLSAETVIIWALWTLMALGLAIAIPAAILGGAFEVAPAQSPSTNGQAAGPAAAYSQLALCPCAASGTAPRV